MYNYNNDFVSYSNNNNLVKKYFDTEYKNDIDKKYYYQEFLNKKKSSFLNFNYLHLSIISSVSLTVLLFTQVIY